MYVTVWPPSRMEVMSLFSSDVFTWRAWFSDAFTAAASTLSVARPVRALTFTDGAQRANVIRWSSDAFTASRFSSVSMRSHLFSTTTMAQPRSMAMPASFWSCSVTPTLASTTSRHTSALSMACRPLTRL